MVSVSFLDTTTTVKEGNMTTDLYSKPTDKHQYLSPSSCHPAILSTVLRVSHSAKPYTPFLLQLEQHLLCLSPHGLHWPTVDEGLDTAALTSVSLMLLGCRNATTGGSGNNLASVSFFSIGDIMTKL
jgi:hypothetical protein